MSKDTKRMILGMLLAFGILIAYNGILKLIWPNWKPGQEQQQPQAQNTTTAPTTAASHPTTGATTTTTTTNTTTGQPAVTAATSAKWHARGLAKDDAATTRPIVLGSDKPGDATYAMGLRLTPRGAAVDEVTLNAFDKSADERKTRFSFERPFDGRADARSMLTRTIAIDGNPLALGDVDWHVDSADDKQAVFSVDVFDGDQRVAKVFKTYKLLPRSDASQGYVVNVTQRVENLSGKKFVFWTVVNGTTTPPREMEQRPDQAVIMGHFVEGGGAKVYQHLISSEFGKEATGKDFTKDDKGRGAIWAGQQSSYFNALVRPVPFDNAARNADWVGQIGADLLNPGALAEFHSVLLNLKTTDQWLDPSMGRDFTYEVYYGPKARKVLGSDFYAAAPRFYDQTLVIASGMCSICTWDWLIRGLVGLLGWFHYVTRDWGVAIILLVLLVRALLHPITKKSQVHMMKMQKMGPELEKLKKKYADDKEALAKAQMAFYKEQGMGPILGCLPMFLQMPIWIALWNALQSTFELRAEPFLYGLTWIKDLAQPDHLVKFDHPVSLLIFNVSSINILPLGLAVVFYLQSKLQPKPPTMTPEQAQQQKMMVWMSTLLFPLFLYTGPAGLNLYILTSTAFGIVESKVIRKHIKEREALEAAMGPTIVDAPDDDAGGAGVRRPGGPKGGGGTGAAPKKKSWLQKLQEKAEELQRQQQQQKKRGK